MSLWLCVDHGLTGPMMCCEKAERAIAITDCGAKGDGKADDSEAIQHAIEDAKIDKARALADAEMRYWMSRLPPAI